VITDASGANQIQATQFTYNPQANVTKVIDPVGRETTLDYDTNGVDVLAVKQKTGASTSATIASAGLRGGLNLYRYAGNNPVNYTESALNFDSDYGGYFAAV